MMAAKPITLVDHADANTSVRETPDIDVMDAALDLLGTIEMALYSEFYWGEKNKQIERVRGALGQAMKLLKPLRDKIDAAA
jgi:hypothetical protein